MPEKSKDLLVCPPQSALRCSSCPSLMKSNLVMEPCFLALLRSLHSILIRLSNLSRQPIVMFTALCLFPSLGLVIERLDRKVDNVFKMIACACQNCTLKKKRHLRRYLYIIQSLTLFISVIHSTHSTKKHSCLCMRQSTALNWIWVLACAVWPSKHSRSEFETTATSLFCFFYIPGKSLLVPTRHCFGWY